MRRKLVLVQSCVRRHLARKELRRLRIEARSVEHVTNLNRGLEMKIIELQQRNDELSEEIRLLRLTDSKKRADFEQAESELAELRTRSKEDHLSMQRYQSELDKVTTMNRQLMARVDQLAMKNGELELSIREAMERKPTVELVDPKLLEQAVAKREHELRQEFERERKALIAERDREQSSK